MRNTSGFVSNRDLSLHSPAGVPFPFSVLIKERANGRGWVFEVSGQDPVTGEAKSNQYFINQRDHASYLNLFEKWALDYGLRLPQNRRPSSLPCFSINYHEVLLRNIDENMLYGYGDPALIRVEEEHPGEGPRFYLLSTSNDAPYSFPILRSNNLIDWEFVDYVFPPGQKPTWAEDGKGIADYWAPEMHLIDDEFRVYFVAREKQSRELCIGVARSAGPEGPFRSDPQPILKKNVIDPHIFVEANGNAYLYWKEDNNEVWPSLLTDLLFTAPHLIPELFTVKEDRITASFILTLWPWIRGLQPMERFLMLQVFIEAIISGYTEFYNHLASLIIHQPVQVQEKMRAVLHYMKTPMFAQLLSPDGSSLVGERTKIIENDLLWEAHLVEGMWVTRQEQRYYLFYAGNDFSTDQYGIGVAIAPSPLGPFEKMPSPFLQSTPEWWAPGHPSVVTGPDGTPQLFLHAYFPNKAGYKQFRALLAVPLTFKKDRVLLQQPMLF